MITRLWDSDSLCYIDAEVRFSGKVMPGTGVDPHWRGSGSLARIGVEGVAVGGVADAE